MAGRANILIVCKRDAFLLPTAAIESLYEGVEQVPSGRLVMVGGVEDERVQCLRQPSAELPASNEESRMRHLKTKATWDAKRNFFKASRGVKGRTHI